MSNRSWITFWHQPVDKPILGTVEHIEKHLKSNGIEYEMRDSNMKDHIAFAVPKHQLQKAIKEIELKFGRNI